MADPTYGRIDPDIQQQVALMNPRSLGQMVAIEHTLQDRRDLTKNKILRGWRWVTISSKSPQQMLCADVWIVPPDPSNPSPWAGYRGSVQGHSMAEVLDKVREQVRRWG